MFKNVASQKITFLLIDTVNNVPKTGDSANLTAYVSKDDGAVTVLGDTTATELDATNAPGLYSFDLTQGETNANKLVFSGKSSTANMRLVPVTIYTAPNLFGDLSIVAGGVTLADNVMHGGSGAAISMNSIATGDFNVTDQMVVNALTVTTTTTLTGAVSLGSTLGITGAFTASNASNNIVGIDVAKISGDSAAADNLESYFDGTGYGEILQRTTIATLANQTEFTLTAGSADNNAYTLCDIVIQDQSTAAQKTICSVLVYTGATKTVYLADSPRFTIATGDIVTILSPRSYGMLINTGSGLDALGTTLDDVSGRIPAALVSGRIDASVGAMAANVMTAAATNADYVTELQAGLATAAALTTVDDFLDTEVAAILAAVDTEIAALPTAAAIADAVWDEVASGHTTAGTFGKYLDQQITTLLTTAMIEAYAADGATITPAQAMYMILQRLTEFAISGTTVTVKKRDGSTTAFTNTVNDATNPTSITQS